MTTAEIETIITSVFLPTVLAIVILSALASLAFVLAHRSVKLEGAIAFLTAFTTLGVCVGFAAGHSRAPVLGAVLPSFLTLISGILTYAFTKDGLKEWRPVIPYGIVIVSLSALVGLSLGSTLRARFDQFERNNTRALLHYQHVELEAERAEYLAKLDVWKQQQLHAARPSPPATPVTGPPPRGPQTN